VGIKPRKRDITRAKQLLAAAGHANGVSATLITTDAYVGAVEIATLVAQQAKDAGFKLKIQKWSGDTYFDEVWLKKAFYMSGWTQRAVPELFLSTTSYSNSIWNESHFRSKQVDRLLSAARVESNKKKRTQLYTQAMKLVHDSCTWIFPVYGNLIHASVKNFSWETLPPSTSGPYTHNMRLS
jgi:peptide/nickel transport system substrate-binding protein